MKLGLLGCGNISQGVVKAINEGKLHFSVTAVFDINAENAKKLADEIKPKPKIAENIDDFLQGIDIVFEGASQEAVILYSEKILSSKKHLMIMSIGAFVDDVFFKRLMKIAKENDVSIYLPSGAVLGIDGLKAAKLAGCGEVTLTTRKNPKNLGLDNKEEKVVFSGTAKEAVKKFPKNINVAAVISLAGIGFEKTKVLIISDPKVKENVHEIYTKGAFGEFTLRTKNFPSPENPRTSYLAVLSAIATLKKIEDSSVQIGT